VGPRAGLDYVKKRKFLTLPELELRPFLQPVTSRYTDYAIPAPMHNWYIYRKLPIATLRRQYLTEPSDKMWLVTPCNDVRPVVQVVYDSPHV
jgi:hypothetical protein